jgi:hypothetical protein
MKFDTYELIETLKKNRRQICQYRWETPLEPNARESYLADCKNSIFEQFEKDEAEKVYELVSCDGEVLITFILMHALY